MKNIQIGANYLLAAVIGILVIHTSFSLLYFELSFIQILMNDLLAVQFIGMVSIIPFVWHVIHQQSARYFSWVYYPVLLMINVVLLIYLNQTGILLGADLFGYTLEDVAFTVKSSTDFDLLPWIILVIALVIFVLLTKKMEKWVDGVIPIKIVITAFCLISWILPSDPPNGLISNEKDFYQMKNPSSHFWKKSIQLAFGTSSSSNESIADYPFLHPLETQNALNEWLSAKATPPNIVIVAVEGLGADFVGEAAKYGGSMPFLDSLSKQSLYWKNCLSNTGRTFGVLPSILGSLPYAQAGFMDLGNEMPAHYTLLNLLSPMYYTSFFYGGNANFDNQDIFLEQQGLDFLSDEFSYPSDWNKLPGNGEGFSWGYGDRELYQHFLNQSKKFPQPNLSFLLTLTTHEPFLSPDPKFGELAKESMEGQAIFKEYPEVFTCLAYADASLKEFIEQYAERPEFENTIFIITGDHRLIPVPAAVRFDRFRVPLVIYSPLIKKPVLSESIVVHSQIAPTILGFMKNNFGFSLPEEVPFISSTIQPEIGFGSQVDVALMRNKNELEEYVSGRYLLSDEKAYIIQQNMTIKSVVNDTITSFLKNKLELFKQKSNKALYSNQLVKEVIQRRKSSLFAISNEQLKRIDSIAVDQSSTDSIYFKALQLARDEEYELSRVLLKFGLNKSPNYHDMRILLSHTFGWVNEFDSATYYLDQTYSRTQNFVDLYIAYADIYYWKKQADSSITWVNKGLGRFPGNNDLLARKARILFETNPQKAKELVTKILRESPENPVANQVKKWNNPQ
ncbi:MAG: LTA synthase family protein [Cyclobacteriaceae bacterium]